MIPHIPAQRQDKSNTNKPFNDLIDYIEEDKGQEKQKPLTIEFENILNYTAASQDKATGEDKCIAIRTHGIRDLATASVEMNAVSMRNTRCKDPAFHFILSWPEHEKPNAEAIFDAAEHAIKALGLAEHQYVVAIHGNTDNIHCHVAVNRIHPETFRSHNIEWARKTLHMAARESEIKHGWTHDNGIYIVETQTNGTKRIVLNNDLAQSVSNALPYAHRELEQDNALPPWHDPDSLETWLKTDVAKSLKRALPKLQDWNALHGWLARYGIQLTDTGGGGMRLHATASETGEVMDLPASKGLRLLKRNELEARWGKFVNGAIEPDPNIPSFPADNTGMDEPEQSEPTKTIVPDLSHLTQKQLTKGVNDVLRTSLDRGIPPNPGQLVLHAEPDRRIPPTHRRGSLHELSPGGLDGDRQDGEMLLPDTLRLYMGDGAAGQDPDLRWSGTGQAGSRRSLNRDNSKREERKEQRAAARADLRHRFSQYLRFVRGSEIDHWKRLKEIKADRSRDIKAINLKTRIARTELKANRALNHSERITINIAIDHESTRLKLKAEAEFQARTKALSATRQPPLGWREWLHEQSNIGDQAALSALRGIVYQAQRDAKNKKDKADAEEEQKEIATAADRERKYRQLMERLLEEEKKEIAIRAASRSAMRPYEVDALLVRYIGMQWRVTGNGNIEYSDRDAVHLFTDRGNRITFDRVRVSDEEIRLALVHAQNKFGSELTLTGEDPEFTARMARLADDMGMKVLNPELQLIVEQHRNEKTLQIEQATIITPTPATTMSQDTQVVIHPTPEIAQQTVIPMSSEERLRAMVLSIDPRATFVIPDVSDGTKSYIGPVVSGIDQIEDHVQGFAQHIGRGVYALHQFTLTENHNNSPIEVRYHNGQPTTTSITHQKDKGRV